jgi:hypothetical protein
VEWVFCTEVDEGGTGDTNCEGRQARAEIRSMKRGRSTGEDIFGNRLLCQAGQTGEISGIRKDGDLVCGGAGTHHTRGVHERAREGSLGRC